MDKTIQEAAKKCFSNNLIKWMSIKNKTQADICAELNLTASTVSDWVKGKKYPRVDKMQALADFLGVSINALRDEQDEKMSAKAILIPVLGYVRAGIPIEAIEDIIDYEEITEEMAKNGDYFGLKIKGDSMSPRIQNGDVVIVRKQESADSGDIVIALINGDDACCKKLIRRDDGVVLQSLNSIYDPMIFSNTDIEKIPVTIIGKVVELRAKF